MKKELAVKLVYINTGKSYTDLVKELFRIKLQQVAPKTETT